MGREARRSLEVLRQGCPLTYFRCEHGIIREPLLTQIREQLGPAATMVELPAAGHHPMFDQPLALVTAARTVLAGWGR